MIPCKNCIYGGVQIDANGTEIQKFKMAEKIVGSKLIKIDYENCDPGCRASFFQCKEDVCVNNSFSEFRQPHPISL